MSPVLSAIECIILKHRKLSQDSHTCHVASSVNELQQSWEASEVRHFMICGPHQILLEWFGWTMCCRWGGWEVRRFFKKFSCFFL